MSVTHPGSLFSYGRSVTYLIPRPLVQSWEGVSKLESDVLAGIYGLISPQTQLIDALIESCKADLFDHFIRLHKHAWRNCKAEDLGCFQVNEQLELG